MNGSEQPLLLATFERFGEGAELRTETSIHSFGSGNEVVGNETGFDKIGRAVSEDLSVPDAHAASACPTSMSSPLHVCAPRCAP